MTAPGRRQAAIETPSGKGAGDENFPVGSRLIAARLRPHVADFYAFARAADDIADNPDLAPAEKIRRLDRFEAALGGAAAEDPALAKAHRARLSMAEAGVPIRHCVDLLHAFKQDAIKGRYDDWHDLMGYCELSANPVGRFLLDLHGESPDDWPASDALCSALQVINHLQDCADDYRRLDRVYLPGDWMAAAGVDVTALRAPAASPGLRQVLDQCLDEIDRLLKTAMALPDALKSPRLAMESGAIVHLARLLSAALRRGDPLAERIELGRSRLIAAAGGAALMTLARRTLGGGRRAMVKPPRR